MFDCRCVCFFREKKGIPNIYYARAQISGLKKLSCYMIHLALILKIIFLHVLSSYVSLCSAVNIFLNNFTLKKSSKCVNAMINFVGKKERKWILFYTPKRDMLLFLPCALGVVLFSLLSSFTL